MWTTFCIHWSYCLHDLPNINARVERISWWTSLGFLSCYKCHSKRGREAEGLGRSVSLSSPCWKGVAERNGLEPSTPFHGVVNINFRKVILEMLIFDSKALILYGMGMGWGWACHWNLQLMHIHHSESCIPCLCDLAWQPDYIYTIN